MPASPEPVRKLKREVGDEAVEAKLELGDLKED